MPLLTHLLMAVLLATVSAIPNPCTDLDIGRPSFLHVKLRPIPLPAPGGSLSLPQDICQAAGVPIGQPFGWHIRACNNGTGLPGPDIITPGIPGRLSPALIICHGPCPQGLSISTFAYC